MVCTALDEAGVRVVLTGGSAATVYAPEAYQSRDLDFVVTFHSQATDAGKTLEALGYRLEGTVYVHENNELTLDFPRGPLAIGDEYITEWDTLIEDARHLHILKPTDSCRDRLAGFLYWNDRGSLAQAVAIARTQQVRVDLDLIRRWCLRLEREEKYLQFRRELDIA